jgi:TPR repeat protein
VPADAAKARELYEKAIATSNRFALRNLAMLLDQGLGGPRDSQRAAKLLLEAAKAHNNAAVDDLRGSMAKWTDDTRIEVKQAKGARGLICPLRSWSSANPWHTSAAFHC